MVKCLVDDTGLPTKTAVHTFFLKDSEGSNAKGSEVVELLKKYGGIWDPQLTDDRFPTRTESITYRFTFNVADNSLRHAAQDSLNLSDSV